MAPYSPSAVGKAAVERASDAVFRAVTLNVKFTIAEVVQMAPDWAFVRTNSAGTTTVHATGKSGPEADQELFVFRKDADGAWKIARYSFSTTNPPPHP
jgi:ketosteroid isomerase-like protein